MVKCTWELLFPELAQNATRHTKNILIPAVMYSKPLKWFPAMIIHSQRGPKWREMKKTWLKDKTFATPVRDVHFGVATSNSGTMWCSGAKDCEITDLGKLKNSA